MSSTLKRVILDTNFLLLPASESLNITAELDRILEGNYELLVLSPCLNELNKLKGKGRKIALAVRLALELINKHAKVINIEKRENESVDDLIIRVAKELNAIVATCDRDLRRRLRREGVPTIFYRAYKKLDIEGEI